MLQSLVKGCFRNNSNINNIKFKNVLFLKSYSFNNNLYFSTTLINQIDNNSISNNSNNNENINDNSTITLLDNNESIIINNNDNNKIKKKRNKIDINTLINQIDNSNNNNNSNNIESNLNNIDEIHNSNKKKKKKDNKKFNIKNQIVTKEFNFLYNDIKIENSSLALLSSISKKKKQKECLSISIDEAGKGALLGPLVVSVVVLDPKKEQFLKDHGVKDSKLLSPQKRESLYNLIIENAIYHQTIILSNHDLDKRRASHNLNEIETNLFYQLIKDSLLNIAENQQVKVYIDSIESNSEKYSMPFKSYFNSPTCEIICETKADSKYTCVGAASIIAKVKRDQFIKNLELELDQPIGSGYPSDALTIEYVNNYLKKNFEFPDSMRKTWSYSGLPKKDINFLLSFKKNNDNSDIINNNSINNNNNNNGGVINNNKNNLNSLDNKLNNSNSNSNSNNGNLINNLISYLKNNNNKLSYVDNQQNLQQQVQHQSQQESQNLSITGNSHQFKDNININIEVLNLFKQTFDTMLAIQNSLNDLKNIIQQQQQQQNNNSNNNKRKRKSKNEEIITIPKE